MIHLERPAAPEFISSDSFKKEQNTLQSFFKEGSTKQKRFEFNASIFRKYRTYLKGFFNKCAYCESNIYTVSFGVTEHFRPKSVYWWLAYEWENQLISCQVCNQYYKASRFPVSKTFDQDEIREKSSKELDKLEMPLLLNPFEDMAEAHFKYRVNENLKEVIINSNSNKGEVSIDTLGLNRVELKQLRYETYKMLKVFLETAKTIDQSLPTGKEVLKAIERHTIDSSQFAGMSRYFVREFQQTNKFFFDIQVEKSAIEKNIEKIIVKRKKTIAVKKKGELPGSRVSQLLAITKLHLYEIEIKNFKSIGHLSLSFRSPEENLDYARKKFGVDADLEKTVKESWLLLLGENGVGKSSVLQAVVLALLPDKLRRKYLDKPKTLVKIGEQEGYVRIKLGDKDPIEMKFNAAGKISSNLGQCDDYLLAYGATRLLPKGNLQPEANVSRIKVKNLFDYSIALENAEQWLIGLSPNDFDQAALFLKDLLFLNENLLKKGKKIYTQENGKTLELGMLSDGYKTLLALAVDILKTFATQEGDARYSDVQKYASGLILIDEIGTHLHPRWKMTIVERLRTALPKVFFIVTSHEPLCMRGLRDKEVVVMVKDFDSGEITSMPDLPSPDGLRVDQLLTSRYFGLNSTIDPIVEENFKKYYGLLGIPAGEKTSADKEEIAKLQIELKKFNQLGENLREELFYFVIDETIAADIRKTGGMKTKDKLRKEVKNKIQGLLNKIDINAL